MEKRDQRLIEYIAEAVLVGWLGYLFLYQNYLLYTWHRGLPLPSKSPFIVAGIVLGALFFWYEWSRLEKEFEKKDHAVSESTVPAVSGGSGSAPLTDTEAGDALANQKPPSENEESLIP
ncbi:hypothetical protein E3E36_04595 [Thermococcus sp. M36]|uniref:hypothetical protein n=1 Tax=Thermococcus sp. M36 TaxID=1638261 RepID=UPI001438779F|nr:hypothetical protein [Thermococcus sp. M36]NJE05431.1 hypothetical protein [Thermococcus sp. M36]